MRVRLACGQRMQRIGAVEGAAEQQGAARSVAASVPAWVVLMPSAWNSSNTWGRGCAQHVYQRLCCTRVAWRPVFLSAVWSLGVVVYEALTGCQPFLADSAEEMAEVQRQRLAERDERGLPRLITERPGLSLEAQSFLAEALQLDPINRASAERLLKHPLLQVRGNAVGRVCLWSKPARR